MLNNYTPNVKDKENMSYNNNKSLPTIYHAAFIDSPDPCSQYYVKKNNPNDNISNNNRKFGNDITNQHNNIAKTPAKQSKIVNSNRNNVDITPDSLTMQYVGDQSTNDVSLSSPIDDDLLTPIKSNTIIYIHQYDDILTPYINQSKRNTNSNDKSPINDNAVRKLEEDSPIKENDDSINNSNKSDGKTKRHTQKLRDLIKFSKEFDSSNEKLNKENTPNSNNSNKECKSIENTNYDNHQLCNTTELYLADEKTTSANIIVPVPPVDVKPNNNIKRFNRKYTCK